MVDKRPPHPGKDGWYWLRENHDGEFGQATGWLYSPSWQSYADGQPAYVWRRASELVYPQAPNDQWEFISVLQLLLSLHEPAGMTAEIVRDKEAFGAYLQEMDARTERILARARTFLARKTAKPTKAE